MVFEMKGKKTTSGMLWLWLWCFFSFFLRGFHPHQVAQPQAQCAGQQGECCPTDTGILMGCCHLTEHYGWSGGGGEKFQFFCHDISEVSQKKLIWQFNRNIFHSHIFLPQKDHSRIQHTEPKRISIFGTRIRSNQCNPLWRGVSYCKHGNFLRFSGLRNVESFLRFLR